MRAQVGEKEEEKKGAERKTSNVKMTGTPRVFKTEPKISLHIPGQLRAWKNPPCEHTCAQIHTYICTQQLGWSEK